MAIGRFLYISRNFPQRGTGLSLALAKFHATPLHVAFQATYSSLPFFHRTSLLEDVVTYENRYRRRASVGGGEWLCVARSAWVFVLAIFETIWHCVKIICLVRNHCCTKTLRKFLHLLPDVSKESVGAPSPLQHDCECGHPFQVHCHCCARSNGVTPDFMMMVAEELEA